MTNGIDEKVSTAAQVMKMVRDVGLPLFQSVILLAVVLWITWDVLQESKADKNAYREQAINMSKVVEANTKASMDVSMALKSLEMEIQRK